MDLTVEGKIIKVMPLQSGFGKNSGKEWAKQEYVIEDDSNEQYPKRIVFYVFGREKIEEMNIFPDQRYKVHFEIDAREYKGRWYNDIRAWKVENPDGGANDQSKQDRAADAKLSPENQAKVAEIQKALDAVATQHAVDKANGTEQDRLPF